MDLARCLPQCALARLGRWTERLWTLPVVLQGKPVGETEFLRAAKEGMQSHVVILERDVGLANLVLGVMNAYLLCEGAKDLRVCVALGPGGSVYHYPGGWHGRKTDSVWEYYYEPLDYAAAETPAPIRRVVAYVRERLKREGRVCFRFPDLDAATGNYGKPSQVMVYKCKGLPYGSQGKRAMMDEVDEAFRQRAAAIANKFNVRPHIKWQVTEYLSRHRLANKYKVGVHIRGTDALLDPRRDGVDILAFINTIQRLLDEFDNQYRLEKRTPGPLPVGGKWESKSSKAQAVVIVASDDANYVRAISDVFGERCHYFECARQDEGTAQGVRRGANGLPMPAYLADAETAAQNGEDMVVELKLLSRCDVLVHNVSNIPEYLLLANPTMKHVLVGNGYKINSKELDAQWRKNLEASGSGAHINW